MFDRGCNETYGCACHDTGEGVAYSGQFVDLRGCQRIIGTRKTRWGGGHAGGGKEGLVEEFAVEG